MTRKEKVREVIPNMVNDNYDGGIEGCPADYTFLNLDDVYLEHCISRDEDRKLMPLKCEECWNTEYEEPARPQWQQDILDKFMRVI